MSLLASLTSLVSSDPAPSLSSRRLADRQKAMGEVERRFSEQLTRERAELARRQHAAQAAHDAGIASAAEALQIALEQGRARLLEELLGFHALVAGYVATPSLDAAKTIAVTWSTLEQRATEELGERLFDEHLLVSLAAPLDRAPHVLGALARNGYAPSYATGNRRFHYDHRQELSDAFAELQRAIKSLSPRRTARALDTMLAEIEAMPPSTPRTAPCELYLEDVLSSATRAQLEPKWKPRKVTNEAPLVERGRVLASIHGEPNDDFREVLSAARRHGGRR